MPHASASFFVFETQLTADLALRRLRRSGFNMNLLSLLCKGPYNEEVSEGFSAQGDPATCWGGAGGFWGGVWSLLSPPALFMLPGLGLVGMTGPLLTTFADVMEREAPAGGRSVLGSALAQVGLHDAEVLRYETALAADKYLLIVHAGAEQRAARPPPLAVGDPGTMVSLRGAGLQLGL